MKGEVYQIELERRDELLAHILYAAVRIKKCEDHLRRTTRDRHTRVANLIEVGGRIFERRFSTVTNLSFLCNEVDIRY
jgi:hypothetical protein